MEKPVTKLSRRHVVIGGGTAAAVGVIAASPLSVPIARETRAMLASQPWARGMLSLASASREQWLDQVGSTFTVGAGMALRLAGVRALGSDGARPMAVARRSAFLAVFDVVGGTMAGDLIYTASHRQYGPLQMFLSTSPDPATPGRMHAVFN